MPKELKKGQIWKNSKATFEILTLGSMIKAKVTKYGESKSFIQEMSPEQFNGMTKIHG
jgi:hypothetical protein